MADKLNPSDRVKLIRWEIYYRAAMIIQRGWRRFLQLSRKHNRYNHRRNRLLSKMTLPHLNTIFNKVMTDVATSEEKFELWRSVIELRRTRNQYSTDAIIRSLVECKGDVSRTMLISGNTSFGWRNAADLSDDSRHKLLPGTSAVELEHLTTFLKSHERTIDARAAIGVSALKRLKDERESKTRVQNGPIDLVTSLTTMYFSKNYKKNETVAD